MKISVIVSTYNSSSRLIKVLCGYATQSDNNFEIIIADDGSNIEHRECYNRYAAELEIPVSSVWQKDDGYRKNKILNQAIKRSQGEYLLFTDGDCIPEPDFVACHRKNAKKGRFLSGGACKLRSELSSKIGLSEIRDGIPFQVFKMMKLGRLRYTFYIKMGAKNIGLDKLFDKIIPVKKTFNGGNSSCWKKDAIAVGGFNEKMGYGGEDREFGYRLQNHGVKPKRIRHSARCVHLDHSRGYRSKEIYNNNMEIIKETIDHKHSVTNYGLNSVNIEQTS